MGRRLLYHRSIYSNLLNKIRRSIIFLDKSSIDRNSERYCLLDRYKRIRPEGKNLLSSQNFLSVAVLLRWIHKIRTQHQFDPIETGKILTGRASTSSFEQKSVLNRPHQDWDREARQPSMISRFSSMPKRFIGKIFTLFIVSEESKGITDPEDELEESFFTSTFSMDIIRTEFSAKHWTMAI